MATINLSWTPATGATVTGQEIHRSVSGGAFTLLASVAAGVGSYSDTTAVDNVFYSYKIIVICSVGGPTSGNAVSNAKVVCPTVESPSYNNDDATVILPALTGDAVYVDYELLDSSNNSVSGLMNIGGQTGPLSLDFISLGYNAGYTLVYTISVGDIQKACELRFTTPSAPECPTVTNLTAVVEGDILT